MKESFEVDCFSLREILSVCFFLPRAAALWRVLKVLRESFGVSHVE